MITPKTLGNYVALGVLAAVSWWLADRLTPDEEKTAPADRSQIDYYSTNITRTVLDTTGKPKELLFAVKMTHYKNDDRTEMDKPVMTLYKKEGEQPWVINAEKGTVLANGKVIFLRGNVLITRDAGKSGLIRIVTKNVKYQPDKNYAETRHRVVIRSAQDEVTGTGMQVYFEPEFRANLLADVRRKHETR
jgi:lipopolysaccharide export system protein LptC